MIACQLLTWGRIFPADAGVNPVDEKLAEIGFDIPRGCGGEPCGGIWNRLCDKYSPRMRG